VGAVEAANKSIKVFSEEKRSKIIKVGIKCYRMPSEPTKSQSEFLLGAIPYSLYGKAIFHFELKSSISKKIFKIVR